MNRDLMDELERRYDGPIPEDMLILARYGSAEAFELSRARGQRRFFANQAATTIRSIRRRRLTIQDGGYDHLPEAKRAELWTHGYADLAFYFREFRKWNAYAWQLERRSAVPSLPQAAE